MSTGAISVSGFGDTSVNGVYQLLPDNYNGYPAYKKDENYYILYFSLIYALVNGLRILYLQTISNQWICTNTSPQIQKT